MLIGFCRASPRRLTCVAGRRARASVLVPVLQGPACAAPTPKAIAAKPAKMTCFVIIMPLLVSHPSSGVFGATLRIYENKGSKRKFRQTTCSVLGKMKRDDVCQVDHSPCADPTVSAIRAPRTPIGFGAPVVVSRTVWCSISASISAPSRMTIAEIQSHVMKPMTAPNEP